MFAGVAIGLVAVPRPFRSRVARLTGARLTGARSGGALQLSDGVSVDCFVTVGGGPVGAVSKCQAAGSVTTPVRFLALGHSNDVTKWILLNHRYPS